MDERTLIALALSELDPLLKRLIEAEERRQWDKIILIPSESLTPLAVREALGSAFTSIYAEGYPREETLRTPEARLADFAEQMAYFRRYADRRFYKGVEYADLVEAIACRRAAEAFANELVSADEIFACVQPLSGANANMAIYEALLDPGDTIMAMDLAQGGHLSHGSPFHQSGTRYRIVTYGVDERTERLDYDRIKDLAVKHRPKLIIAGYTSYPWAPDWRAFREIADAAGALLLADIAHTAGMAIAGAYPNPVGWADVVMFTTHKTLCGPRGALILTCDPEIAKAIEGAVFPGAQGGPHVNKFAAIAVAFQLAKTESFKALQHRIVDNAKALAAALAKQGLRLAYGGTDTHLLVIDLRAIDTPNGRPLMGEIAARVLDLVGLVANKNTIPGDTSAADARGVRYGTPWVTQRGMGEKEMEEIAEITARLLTSVHPFTYPGLMGPLPRGKLPLAVLEEARERVRALAARFSPPKPEGKPRGEGRPTALLVYGGRAEHLLHEACSAHVLSLNPGEARRALFFDGDGELIVEAVVGRLPDDELERRRFLVLAPPDKLKPLSRWLSALADGYVLFDSEDICRKVQGPAVVEEVRDGRIEFSLDGRKIRVEAHGEVKGTEELFLGVSGDIKGIYGKHPELFSVKKPYFVGEPLLRDLLRTSHSTTSPVEPHVTRHASRVTKNTPLTPWHREQGANMAEFAGYEMPLWYRSALEEHRAVRERAGLFDLGHMGVFRVAGRYAEAFLNLVTTNYAGWLQPGQSQYAFLLDPEGRVIDDVMVYRRGREEFLVVVNAANEGKDWEWLNAVNSGEVLVDPARPWIAPDGEVELCDLKAQGAEDGRVDLALQGPASREVLARLLSPRDQRRLRALRRTEFLEFSISGKDVLLARTGYTGEPLGYELYVHPQDAEALWTAILDAGKPLGVIPCGLAARDSLRTEAGLPLYGHELAGEHAIMPHEAGFAPYVKLHKAFFIGREAYVKALSDWKREIVRFRIPVGERPVRAGAGVVDRAGRLIGRVTSCVALEHGQVGLALLWRRALPAGTPLGFLIGEAPRGELKIGTRLPLLVWGKVLPRFPERRLPPRAGEE